MRTTLFKTLAAIFLFSLSIKAIAQNNRYQHLLIGTYTKSQNNGIFVYKFDTETGKLSFTSKTEGIKNPSFLTLNNNATKVYSVSEGASGQVSSFSFDSKTGQLLLINSQETTSPGPCYENLTADNKFSYS